MTKPSNNAPADMLDCGEAVLAAFRALGVDYVMSSPGSEWGPVWEAFARQKMANAAGPTYLSCAHETLAVDLAIGYTAFTGRMQAVMLHTGVGLLQGAMGIDAAQRQGLPMLIVSGESASYGEREGFDPGHQWYATLSTRGGPASLVQPLTKWANRAASPETLFQQLAGAGEIARRAPTGPTYLSIPIETMLAEWRPPAIARDVPQAPKPVPAQADIEKVAALLARAKNPAVVAESIGRDAEGYSALVVLAELLAIPVVDAPWADYANFPKEHALYQGAGRPALLDEADVVLCVRTRAPFYPPGARPAKAVLVAIDEAPFRPHMDYQNVQADIFLEGDAVAALTMVAKAVRAERIDTLAVGERRARLMAAHAKRSEELRAVEANAAPRRPIDPVALVASLNAVLPHDTIYVDETITHRGAILKHLANHGPQSYFRVMGGLGQGMGVALGVKLAAKTRPVLLAIGDGSFMYNPVVQSLALAKQEGLPILIVVFNNRGYAAMKKEQQAYYPDGVGVANDLFYGHTIAGLDYAELAAPFGGYGRTVDDPAELPAALEDALAAMQDGRTAILNVLLGDTTGR